MSASSAPRYSRKHWDARIQAVGQMFTTAGVDATTERVLLYVKETAWIPWVHPPKGHDRREYFRPALSKALRDKDGDYQTAPQVSSIWRAFRDLLPKSEWRHYAGGRSLPPKWSKTAERLQDRLDETAASDPRALAAGDAPNAADGLQAGLNSHPALDDHPCGEVTAGGNLGGSDGTQAARPEAK